MERIKTTHTFTSILSLYIIILIYNKLGLILSHSYFRLIVYLGMFKLSRSTAFKLYVIFTYNSILVNLIIQSWARPIHYTLWSALNSCKSIWFNRYRSRVIITIFSWIKMLFSFISKRFFLIIFLWSTSITPSTRVYRST